MDGDAPAPAPALALQRAEHEQMMSSAGGLGTKIKRLEGALTGQPLALSLLRIPVIGSIACGDHMGPRTEQFSR